MNGSIIYLIAKNELNRIVFHPLIVFIGIIILVLTYLNGAGGVFDLQSVALTGSRDGFLVGFSQIWYVTTFICSIMAAFLGVTAMSEERWKNSINVLISKPLYRKDIIIGKFIGLCIFVLIFLILIMLFNSLILLYYYGQPLSYPDVILRLIIYIFAELLDFSLVIALALLIGTLFKNNLLATSIVITYLSLEFFWNSATYTINMILHFPIAPYAITMSILGMLGDTANLFDSNVQFNVWLNAAMPFIILMILLVILTLLIDCFVFTRMDDA